MGYLGWEYLTLIQVVFNDVGRFVLHRAVCVDIRYVFGDFSSPCHATGTPRELPNAAWCAPKARWIIRSVILLLDVCSRTIFASTVARVSKRIRIT